MEYIPHGVCSRLIHIDLDGDTIKSVEFVGGCSVGGCSGNTQGISHLVKGMNVHDAIARLEGIRCGNKPTSNRLPARISYPTP